MPVGRRYKVKCGICGSTFNKDYTSKHCRNSHLNYNITTLPTTICQEPNQSSISTLLGSHVEDQIQQPPQVVIDTQPQDNPLLRDQPDEAIQSTENQSHSHYEVAENDEVVLHENDDEISEEITKLFKTTSDSSHSETESTGSVTIERNMEHWTTCYGKLQASTIGECQELLFAADNTDAPNPKHLLGNLVDVVQRINVQSSCLTEMAISEITKLDVSTEQNHSCHPPDYIPMEHDPAKR